MTETLLTYKVHINKLTDRYPINIIIQILILSKLSHYRPTDLEKVKPVKVGSHNLQNYLTKMKKIPAQW